MTFVRVFLDVLSYCGPINSNKGSIRRRLGWEELKTIESTLEISIFKSKICWDGLSGLIPKAGIFIF
jgi:hypothetical protein